MAPRTAEDGLKPQGEEKARLAEARWAVVPKLFESTAVDEGMGAQVAGPSGGMPSGGYGRLEQEDPILGIGAYIPVPSEGSSSLPVPCDTTL